MMGKFPAEIPTDRLYARNHMWARAEGDVWQFGFTAYAVRLLQDVYFLDWTIDPPADLGERQEIGCIESSKAESDLFAPIRGRLVEFNENLLRDPSLVNVDKYGRGWLFRMLVEGDPPPGLLSPEEYLVHLKDAWKVAERTIKGQLNE